MIVTSTGITNGLINDKYGKRGTHFNKNGIPNYSIPLKIEHSPKDTVSYALVLEDKDSYPVTEGFVWIHWIVANLTRTELLENESITAGDIVQGSNSWTSVQGGKQSKDDSSFYGGMGSPDAPHIYEIHVYALNKMLDLEKGFLLNELYRKMDGHIIDSFTLKGLYED